MKTVPRLARTIVSLLLSSCIVCMSAAPAVFAQDSGSSKPAGIKGITLSPPLKEVILGPGLLEAKTKITLTNTTDNDMYASLRLVDFDAISEFGDISFSAAGALSSKYALAHWMSLPAGNTTVIPSGKSTEIPVTIANSNDLSPGGHYGAVIATISGSPAQSGPNTVKLKQEVVSLLFIKKTGGEVYGLELESLKTNAASNFPDQIVAKFKNTGNTHVVPRGYIEITNSKGVLISKGILNPESSMVLPEGGQQFITLMQPVASPGKWGEYTITAYYRYDGQNKFASKSIHYSKKPFSTRQTLLATGVVTLTVILVLGIWAYRRSGIYKVRH